MPRRGAIWALGSCAQGRTNSVGVHDRKKWMRFAGFRPGPGRCGLNEATGTRTDLAPPTRLGGPN